MKKYLLLVALPIFLVWSAYVLHHLFGNPDYSLYKNGVKTQAEITGTECSWHEAATYEYSVDGKKYSNTVQGIDDFLQLKKCGQLAKGDPIVITYLRADPKINAPGELTEAKFYYMAAAYLPGTWLFSAFVFFSMRRRKD